MITSSTRFLGSMGAFLCCLVAQNEARAQNFAPPTCIAKYAFYPQGGNFFEDLFPVNFVDLDPGAGVVDYNCSNYANNGDPTIDTAIMGGFTAQAIGVPVFAVLDGVVVETHDGEGDMNSTPDPKPDNHIKIDHGNGHVTTYGALKKNSVAVAVSETVKAGQQIALTGSSGASFRPYLSFASQVNGAFFEPFAGGCRSGESNWIKQPSFRSGLYLRQFVITGDDLTSFAGPPFDTARTGTFVIGTRAVNFWFVLGNGQGVQNISMRYLRPDGSQRLALGPFNAPANRNANYQFNININLDVPGTWQLEVSINGQVLTQAPFTVIASGSAVNRVPGGVQTAFDPVAPVASDVVFCRVNAPTVYLDPDYDFVRYRYVWQVNGITVRDIVSAALSDAIPRNTAQAGDTLSCTVTTSDGVADGPATTLSLVVATPAAVADNLLNISTRLRVQTGDSVLIGGMIATGNEQKKVLIRALGPSLGALGVPGAVEDTTLELFSGDTRLAENDNWRTGGQEAEIQATTIPPSNDLESAIIATLSPNQGYTAVVRGKDGATGIAVVEAYDLDQAADSRLANISTRGFVETGDNVLIAGFILGGNGKGGATVAVRALGPSLANSGVPNPLFNPTLEIVNGNGVRQESNDDWKECEQADIEAIGLQPADDRESTILAKLPPGPYTAIVRGAGNTTGVGLVEVYNLR